MVVQYALLSHSVFHFAAYITRLLLLLLLFILLVLFPTLPLHRSDFRWVVLAGRRGGWYRPVPRRHASDGAADGFLEREASRL